MLGIISNLLPKHFANAVLVMAGTINKCLSNKQCCCVIYSMKGYINLLNGK